MHHESTQASLLVRLRDPQDAQAWEQFVRIYLPAVFRLARRYGLDEAEAADATQEVLTAVHQKIGAFDYDPARGSFRGWLKTVARSRICDLLAARRKQPRGTGDTDALQALEQTPGRQSEDQWERDYQQGLFAAALDQVGREVHERTLRAFVRCAVNGLSPSEAAEELGLSVGAVYVAKSRVTARLREIIQLWEREEREHGE